MVSPTARKQLEKVHKKEKKKIVTAIRQLESDPFKNRPKADIKKLSGVKKQDDLYRLRSGNYRIIYEVSDDKVWISEIVKRGGAYKFLL